MAYCGPWGIFVHIPKCGGDLVRNGVGEMYGNDVGVELKGVHCNGRGLVGDKFTIIRDPLMWMRSYHTYMRLASWKWVAFPPKLWEMLGGERGDDFEGFVKWCGDRPGIIKRFYDYYIDDDIRVFCLEKPHIFEYLGIKNQIVHETRSKPEIKRWMVDMILDSEYEIYNLFYDGRSVHCG